VPLTIWWDACGFSKLPPLSGQSGKGWCPQIPDAILHSNDREVYAAFVRGLYEADGNANSGYWSTTNEEFSRDVQTLMLTLGFVTTRGLDDSRNKLGAPCHRLRLLNARTAARFAEEIGFMSDRKNQALQGHDHSQAERYDHIPVARKLVDELAPTNDRLRKGALLELSRTGAVSRRLATQLLDREPSAELETLMGYFYDTVAEAELIEDRPTFDLSVPDNVTYVANGFVSHNTISFLMDCDTTGVEPDFSLVKFKELVGGGQMKIVNRTVPLALKTLSYSDEHIEQILAYVNEHGTIIGAPGLDAEDLPVFDVAVGERAISHMGHIKMMGAVQPFISGAISKCVTGDTLVASDRGLVKIEGLHNGEAPDSFSQLDLQVASLDGPRSTDAFYYGGQRPVREVRLRSGHRVVGTPNHRLLTCGDEGLAWRRLDELQPGELVATQYGDDIWSPTAARFDDFNPSPAYGSQKAVTIPKAMSESLGFFLGAFAAEGHITRSVWTVKISNADEAVLPVLADTAEKLFGLRPRIVRAPGKCPSVEVSSKRIVEFLDYLGCGHRAANKRIPDAVLRSPRDVVLRFLDGLCLDAYITTSGLAKWAICLDSGELLDDLQAVLTNLGVVHGRITKAAPIYNKTFDEVYAAGREAQRLLAMLHFVEPHKAVRAAEIISRGFAHSTSDVVPGVTGDELYALLPGGRSGCNGQGSGKSRRFRHLVDPRTAHVSRTSLDAVATVEGVELPDWLDTVLERNLHFSPIVSNEDAGTRAVYDISVPETHAFVANGIVNHNTVNMPHAATVEDIADAYIQSWRLGVKALAIYRDGSKTAQALRTDAQQGKPLTVDMQAEIDKAVTEALTKVGPKRRRMPRERQSLTHKFSIGGHEGYITAGMYEDGTVGEIFLTDIGKEGSTLRGMMNAFATAISIALQYGVPLETLVRKFSYMRFEPEGMTSNPEIPFSKSMPDYIMRWLASRFLDTDLQEELGILTKEVRARKAAEDAASSRMSDTAGPSIAEPAKPNGAGQPAASALTDDPPVLPAVRRGLDLGPACQQCGGMMQRTGSCYTCGSCGFNTGCG
jgi:intein/homing endonuclease